MRSDAVRDVGVDPGSGGDLLPSKFEPAPAAAGLGVRPRLLETCAAATHKRLTLIEAPAGYGKTCLLAALYRELADDDHDGIVAWLSLEPSENDPALYWRYVVGALRSAGFEGGSHAEDVLRVPGADVEAGVRALINDLVGSDRGVVVILDDYHAIGDPSCHKLTAFLLEHAPENVHLVIATRSQPPLPLASMRAAGQLTEIRAPELRLTPAEVAAYVELSEGVSLQPDELALLTTRTEGWAVALQLAVLWLRDQPDQRGALVEFAGDNRHLVDYLGEQVLAALDPPVEQFLLETSILDRFCAPLCEAVTGRARSAELLKTIERANLFLVPLDGRRRWFRYHQLFRGLLQAQLAAGDPNLPLELHRRAYAWHREHGTTTESVNHATLAGDWAAAADAIGASWITLIRAGRSTTVQRWLHRFPDQALADAPELGYVGAFVAGLAGGTEAEIDAWLEIAERAAEASGERAAGPMPDGTTSFAVNVDMMRAAFIYRDVGAAVEVAERVVAAERGGGEWKVPALATLAFLRHISGDAEAAHLAASAAVGDRDVPRRPHGAIQALATLSLLETEAGDGEKGERTARRALEAAVSVGLAKSVTTGLARVAMGAALLALGRPDEARPELERAASMLEGRAPTTQHLYALLVLAEAQRASGDLVAAHRSADAAELLIDSFTDAGVFPAMLAALRERAQLLRKRRPAAPGAELSESELAVLRLLAGPQSRREIADELYVSANTVKTHVSSIYRKLGVSSRADAVFAARRSHLI